MAVPDTRADLADVQPITNANQNDISAQDSSEKMHSKVVEHAKLASDKEQKMTLMQGIRLYPKAIFWSFVISTCIVMEGYDVCLVNNFYAFSQFNKKYGVLQPDGSYQVPAPWQAGLSNVSASSALSFAITMDFFYRFGFNCRPIG